MGELTQNGSGNVAEIYLKNQPQNPELYLGLFINDLDETLIPTAAFSDLTEPAALSYARQVLIPINWTTYGQVSVYPEMEFEVSLEPFGTVYGCFIATSNDASGKIVAIHKFTTPGVLQYYGDRIRITPRITIT